MQGSVRRGSENSWCSSNDEETTCPRAPSITPMDDPVIPDDYSLEGQSYSHLQARLQPKARSFSAGRQHRIILTFLEEA